MKIDFDVTADDFLAFNEYYLRRSSIQRRQVMRGAITCFIIACGLPLLVLLNGEKPFFQTVAEIWPLFLGPVVIIPLYIAMMRRNVRRSLKMMIENGDAKGALGFHSLRSEPDGLFESSQSGDSRINWSSIKNIAVVSGRLFVYLDNASGHVIPCQAFADVQQLEQFVSELSQYTKINPDWRNRPTKVSSVGLSLHHDQAEQTPFH